MLMKLIIKLIKWLMNITKFHKIPTNGASNSNSFTFPKIGLYYHEANEIVLFRFPNDDINFPVGAFIETLEDLSDSAEILFYGIANKFDIYVDDERGKSISNLKLDIFKDDENSVTIGDRNGEAVATLLGLDPEVVIPIAGTFISSLHSYKFAAIMNGTSGYGYVSSL